MKQCPFCIEEIQDQAMTCQYCGHSLDQQLCLWNEHTAKGMGSLMRSRPRKISHGRQWFQFLVLTIGSIVSLFFIIGIVLDTYLGDKAVSMDAVMHNTDTP